MVDLTPKLKADLHIHTNFSDGAHSPAEIIQFASTKGLDLISITDHDTIAGLELALELNRDNAIEIINGVELSTYLDGVEIHLLGYLFDLNNQNFLELLKTLYDGRLNRAKRICKRLEILGVELTIEEVLEISGISAVGRPHIAAALVKKGYAENIYKAFDKYLMQNSPFYVPKENLNVFDAIKAVHDAGGLTFTAHPGNITEHTLIKLVRGGLDGIEVIHPSLKAHQTRELKKFVKTYNLLESGGSDFHGGTRNDQKNFGVYHISPSHVEKMKEFLASKNN
ncbi:MAG: phosphatase [Melioribacteraceae bacterium]|nr:MAG: phosphatase [Melioribacteraceae bacterium]